MIWYVQCDVAGIFHLSHLHKSLFEIVSQAHMAYLSEERYMIQHLTMVRISRDSRVGCMK